MRKQLQDGARDHSVIIIYDFVGGFRELGIWI